MDNRQEADNYYQAPQNNSEFNQQPAQQQPAQQPAQQQSYQGNNNNNGGFKKFPPSFRIPVPTTPYNACGIIFSNDVTVTDQHVQLLQQLLNKLKPHGFTIRYQPGNVGEECIPTDMPTEKYLPFPDFDDVKGDDLIFASKANKELLPVIHPKGNEIAKGYISRNGSVVSILAGGFNNSPIRVLFVISNDTANHGSQCGRDTGYISPTIKMAAKFGIPVININDIMGASATLDGVLKYF